MRAQSDGWSRMQSPVCQRGGFLRHGLMLEQLLAKHSSLASVAIMMAGRSLMIFKSAVESDLRRHLLRRVCVLSHNNSHISLTDFIK